MRKRCLMISMCLLSFVVSKAQLHFYAGAGTTNGLPGVELCVGYRHSQGAYGVGFTAAADAGMLLIVHARATLLTQNGFVVGAGPAWVVYSSHATNRNSLQAQLYAAYHFCFYKRLGIAVRWAIRSTKLDLKTEA